jgi:hypothetical protein
MTFLRGLIARGLTKFFQAIVCLSSLLGEHHDVVANQNWICPRAIAVPVEQLLLTPAPSRARYVSGRQDCCDIRPHHS